MVDVEPSVFLTKEKIMKIPAPPTRAHKYVVYVIKKKNNIKWGWSTHMDFIGGLNNRSNLWPNGLIIEKKHVVKFKHFTSVKKCIEIFNKLNMQNRHLAKEMQISL